jgi:hypothetical protein
MPTSARRAVGRILRRTGLRRGPAPLWVASEPNPQRPDVLDDFRLFAIIGAWMEADVVAATVANAFTQGCERVYLVDNDSSDATVHEAVAAGAVLAESFATEEYDETLRLEIMNRVVRDVSESEPNDHIWWLFLDADEFPHGPRGQTIGEYLASLDRRFRIVGGRFMNHFPDRDPAYVTGRHPLDFQPLCEEHPLHMCVLNHRKHSLQRFDRVGEPIFCGRGFHSARSNQRPLLEPTDAIFIHHFPYRDPAVTRARLASLCDASTGGSRVNANDDAGAGIRPRFETLEAVYRQDWDHVRSYDSWEFTAARPRPWTDFVDERDAIVSRWYEPQSTSDGAIAE